MVKAQQLLIIKPEHELRFMGPFTGEAVTSYMTITNPTNNKIFFKIKTTAPKRYCVRPNAGCVLPKATSQIAVTLQSFDFDPTEKNKHKFMVQAIIAPNDDDEDYSDLWKDLKPEQVMESKLKCVFKDPEPKADVPEVNLLRLTEEKLFKAAEQFSQLRAEESILRQENLQLREDLLKLQNTAMGNDAPLAAARDLTSQSSNQLPRNATNIIVAMAMVIVGYLLGKLI
ncbi:PREDICTED: vesicle-associated membrane protein-associated protein A [Dufourea novaeangliae]|uniref:Vesicle-associated membrane protein-associated protein A n=1 Tax=Dufourea novaeangliae TaxID=178035 RepID=A0A154PJT6_DUFNO|nr:PREDICTED: vesicle-associated membrane protein-associated protein A [Dufourea novaeangliae]KZC12057.1 Vesicle-associated membrane protein-associated protein A [Dufourea novaeangliae]